MDGPNWTAGSTVIFTGTKCYSFRSMWIPEGRPATMQGFILRQNIKRYERLLAGPDGDATRQRILNLLLKARRELRELEMERARHVQPMSDQ
jgi:hypothetical protein